MIEKYLKLIETALNELEELSEGSKMYGKESLPYQRTKKVFLLFREEIGKKTEDIDETLLRAMHNIGISSFKDFENTKLENSILKITASLRDDVPTYKTLEPLDDDPIIVFSSTSDSKPI